jgi:hypothetical protein
MMTTFTQVLHYIQNEQLSNDDLNRIIEAVKWSRTRNAKTAARTLRIGEQVQFNGRRGLVVGRLEQIKIKKAIVVSGQTRWNVPLAMLEAV